MSKNRDRLEAALTTARELVKKFEAELASVFDSIRAMQPDASQEEPFDGMAQALMLARARLEVARVRLSAADGAFRAASSEVQE
jgi:hypothetical protein